MDASEFFPAILIKNFVGGSEDEEDCGES